MPGFLNSVKALLGVSSKKKRRSSKKASKGKSKGKTVPPTKTKKVKKMKGGMVRDGVRPSTWPRRS